MPAASARPLADLRDGNAGTRAITDDAAAGLGYSLAEFGDLSGIVANAVAAGDGDGGWTLIAGHQRLAQLRAAGAVAWTLLAAPEGGQDGAGYVEHPATGARFPVRLVSWPAEKAAAARLTANNQEIAGTFTALALPELEALRVALPEFGALRLGTLLERLRVDLPPVPAGGDADPDDVPAPPVVPVSRTGDLWLMGAHRLLAGDATVPADVARVMAGERAVLMATDPPYGVGYDPDIRLVVKRRMGGLRSRGKVMGDETSDWVAALGADTGCCVAYVWFAAMRAAEARVAVESAGFQVRQEIIWAKQANGLSRSRYFWQHECAWFATRGPNLGPWYGGQSQQGTVWNVAKNVGYFQESERTGHPTQKPVELFAIPIRNHTLPGEVCYEPFSGSGTQIIAAEQLGRRCYAIEIVPQYVDVAVARWQKYANAEATLDGDGRTFAAIAAERTRPPRRATRARTAARNP